MCSGNKKVCKITEKTLQDINVNFDDYTNENKTKHNLNWPYIPDHPYRILIIGGLLNLINNQPDMIKYICMQKIRMKININF